MRNTIGEPRVYMSSSMLSSKKKDLVTVKQTIRALLLSAKNGLTVGELCKDYKDMFGEPIPLKDFGCNTVMDLVLKMPEAVMVQKSRGGNILVGIPDSSSAHVAKLVSRQKNSKSYSSMISSNVTSGKKSIPRNSGLPSVPELPLSVKLRIKQLLISYPDGLPIKKFQEAFNKRFGYYLHVGGWGFTDLLEALHSVDNVVDIKLDINGETIVCGVTGNIASVKSGTIKVQPVVKEESLNALETEKPKKLSVSNTLLVSNKPHPIPVEITHQLNELLLSCNAGIWASDLLSEYENYFNEELPVSSLGYPSVIDLLMALPDVIDVERPISNGDWLVFAKGKKTASAVAMRKTLLTRISLPKGLVRTVHKMLESSSTPVTASIFPSLFKKTTNRDLPIEEYGFSSTLDFLEHIPYINVVPTEDSTDCIVVPCGTDLSNEMVATNKEKKSTKVFSTYSRQPIPRGSKAFGVYVTYVKSPSCLCVQIIGEDTTQALDSLHEDMAQFYNSAAGDKSVIEEAVIGQPCCSRFNNDGYWYRAKVIAQTQPDIVEVKYVDYGNTGLAPTRSLRQPKPHYLALPAQAIECRLSNIMPVGSTWSKRACQMLFDMTKEKPIAAIVTSITKDNVVSLCLCDTTTERDIHINDCLVNQGIALFSADVNKHDISIDEYEMESCPSQSSAKEINVRLPKTTSSIESLSTQTPTFNESAQLSQQQMMLQLLTLMQQNSLLLQQPHAAPLYNQYIPSQVSTSLPVPPGFNKISSVQTVSTPQLSPIELSPVNNKEYIPIINNSNAEDHAKSSKKTVVTDSTDSKIKKVSFDATHSLHILCYNDHLYAFSNEISSWFWESDLLQYRLHKIPCSPCNQLIYDNKAPSVFEQLKKLNDPVFMASIKKGQISVYPLEDVPVIVEKLKCPQLLCAAVKKVVNALKEKGLAFWLNEDSESDSNKSSNLKDQLKELQDKRTSLLLSLMKTSSLEDKAISDDTMFNELVSVDKDIKSVKQQLVDVEINEAVQTDPDNDSLAFSEDLEHSFDSLSLNSTVTNQLQSTEDVIETSTKGQALSICNNPPTIPPNEPTSNDDSILVNETASNTLPNEPNSNDDSMLVNDTASNTLPNEPNSNDDSILVNDTASNTLPNESTHDYTLPTSNVLPFSKCSNTSITKVDGKYVTSQPNTTKNNLSFSVSNTKKQQDSGSLLSVTAQPFLPINVYPPSNTSPSWSHSTSFFPPQQPHIPPPHYGYGTVNPPFYSYPYQHDSGRGLPPPPRIVAPLMFSHPHKGPLLGIGRGNSNKPPLIKSPLIKTPPVGLGRGETGLLPSPYMMNFAPMGSGVGMDII